MTITRPTRAATLVASTAVAASLGVATGPATPVAADDPPLVEHCVTYALTEEEVEEGAVSEIDCWWEEEYTPLAARSASLMMVHWDLYGGGGSALDVLGSGCTGLATNLSGTSWDNRISSTTHISCGNAKHYTGVFSGSNQLTQGGFGFVVNMNSTLNNAVTSVDYAP